jgi:hypothetical protein
MSTTYPDSVRASSVPWYAQTPRASLVALATNTAAKANSRYATIRADPKTQNLYLYIKEAERSRTCLRLFLPTGR